MNNSRTTETAAAAAKTTTKTTTTTRRRASYQQSIIKKGQPHPTHSPTSCTSGLLQILTMELPVAPDLPIAQYLQKDMDTLSSSFKYNNEDGMAESSTATRTTTTTTTHSGIKVSSSFYIPGITEKARSCLQKTQNHPLATSLCVPDLPRQLTQHRHHGRHNHRRSSSAVVLQPSCAASSSLLEPSPIRCFETMHDFDDDVSTLSQTSCSTKATTTTATTAMETLTWRERQSTKALLQSQLGSIQDLFEELDSRKGVKNFKQLQLKKKNRISKS